MRRMTIQLASLALAVVVMTGCSVSNTANDMSTEVAALPALGIPETETVSESAVGIMESEMARYVSKDYFYTDFEGKSVIQTDEEETNTICQRSLQGELTDSYYMGEKFSEIFYVDEDWLYYSELDDTDSLESVYRVPLSHKEGRESPEFSEKEFLFTESEGLSGSDFARSSFLQVVEDTIYYCAGRGLGTYNLKTKEQRYYPVQDKKEDYMNAAGTRYMIAEGKNQCDVLTDLETGDSEVLETEHHPWLRLGREFYFRFPYSPFPAGGILLDLNSGETIEVLSQGEGERVAEEMGVVLDKEWLASEGWNWDGISIKYIGYYNHRVYAEIQYHTMAKDKKGREIPFQDAVCVSRNMDEEKGWTVEQEITAYGRKKIMKYYEQVEEGSYKIKKEDDGEIEEFTLVIGEGIANGIFYFNGCYKKDGKLAMDIYDLKEKELRVIGRNSPETFYPFYDNSREIMTFMHAWQNIRVLAPIMGQSETLWEQKQKRKQP